MSARSSAARASGDAACLAERRDQLGQEALVGDGFGHGDIVVGELAVTAQQVDEELMVKGSTASHDVEHEVRVWWTSR